MERSVLHEEHLLLGASFAHHGPLVGPRSYALPLEKECLGDGTMLCDLSGMGMFLLSGAPASDFARAALSGRELAIGECAFEATLLGDGNLASIPLCVRTGQDEYVLWDASPRSEVLGAWVDFLSHVEQDDRQPFRGLVMEDASERLVPLVLWGTKAASILEDYTDGPTGLPGPGEVAQASLDGHIPSIVAHPVLPARDCFFVLVPPQLARIFWRSLLSFGSVMPVGHELLTRRMREQLPLLACLDGTDTISVSGRRLRAAGVTRAGNDFVGARGLEP